MANVDQFKFVSFNVNGLQNTKKRRDAFHFLREMKCHVFFLQETHLTVDSENFIRACWGYNLWLAGRSTNSKGVAILFNNNFEYKVHDVIKDPHGCYIVMDLEILKKRITLVNVYGPSSGDDPQLFQNVSNLVSGIGNENVVMGGDWNCALDFKIDVSNYDSVIYRPRMRKQIFDTMASHDLVDIWRDLHPTKKSFTWRRFRTTKQARLDYFLVSRDLLSDVVGSSIASSHLSDHSPIVLSFRQEQFRRDRPHWKHNLSLLRDRDYLDEIKEGILEVKKRYALPIYNYDKIAEVPPEELQLTISDQLFFEVLMLEIRGRSICYSSLKKKLVEEEEKQLTAELKVLERSVSEETVQRLEEVRRKLESIRNKRMEGVAIRSRMTWLLEGEKPTKYFCKLENRNYVSKALSFIDKGNNEIISNQEGILKEVQSFYEQLYSCRDVTDVDLNDLLPDVPTVSPEQNEAMEGPITYHEAAEALKAMPNGRSPGLSGFTVEFYKFFFVDVGMFLVRSINEGFEKGELSTTQKQGIITCIPKEGKPKQFIKNLRPISLLNVSYKIASACLARRIQQALPGIIHESQKGFMKGRYIGEGIRCFYDVMKYTEQMKIPGLVLSVDFEKAFDSVSWSFLEKCLHFFKFSPCIVRWFKTLYNNASSCVHLNGQYSKWFPLQRGCRQGDPVSPYLYLIAAEVLSLMIRRNNEIKGISIQDQEVLLRLFADDTTLFLDGSEKSFCETIRTLDHFATISGLKINNEKTQILWIGSRRHCGTRFMRDRNFTWDPGIVKVLGIIFSINIEQMVQLNYDGKLEEIKTILARWKRRNLTPYGKITVMKTLVISKLTYLFLNIPDPPAQFLRELDNELFSFLWDGKQAKIKKSIVYKSYQEGGLKMCDVYAYLASMKISWLRRLMDDTPFVSLVTTMYPPIADVHKFGVEYVNVLLNRVKNSFWNDVFRHFKTLIRKCPPTNEKEFLGVYLHYNDDILRDRRVVYIKQWVDAGVMQVQDLLNSEGSFLSFDNFRRKYPNLVGLNFLMYYGVIQAVQQYQRRLGFELAIPCGHVENKVWTQIVMGPKAVQIALKKNDCVPTALSKWNTKYLNLDWKIIFNKIYVSTIENQLRWFQLRLLHRMIATKRYLFLRKRVDSQTCTLCTQATQTIEHLFWHCDVVRKFWKDFEDWLHACCEHTVRFSLSEKIVLLSVDDNLITDQVIDYIILLAKYVIYTCALNDTVPTLQHFKQTLKYRYSVLKLAAIRKSSYTKFAMNWFPYLQLIS